MDKNTLLYVLSTLAQTCAALAAFVGFIGINRIQSLRQIRNSLYDDIRAQFEHQAEPPNDAMGLAYDVADVEPEGKTAQRLRRFHALPRVIQQNTKLLAIFELWQLIIILLSLIGFVFIDTLVGSWYASVGLVFVAIVTVSVTAYCVLVWFRNEEGL